MIEPSWRKPTGIFAILALIFLWSVGVATLAESISGWPALLQAIFYLVAGISWILPLKPLLRWIETGRSKD